MGNIIAGQSLKDILASGGPYEAFKAALKQVEKSVAAESSTPRKLSKSIARLKTALAQRTKADKKTAKASKLQAAMSINEGGSDSKLSRALAIAFGDGGAVNVKGALSEWGPHVCARLARGESLVKVVQDIKSHKKFMEWMATSLTGSGQQQFIGTVPPVGFAMPIRREIKSKDDAAIWAEKQAMRTCCLPFTSSSALPRRATAMG